MKQPDLTDIGTQMDVVKYRLMAAKDDLDTANSCYFVLFIPDIDCMDRVTWYGLGNSSAPDS